MDLIAEAWDAGGLYQVGQFPSWNRWAEWNGKYRDDLRSFLKGDDGLASAAAKRIIGSPDLYPPDKRGYDASVNFITCHDGFTLYDLYAYNQKHNENNGWNNTDGADDNRSWNCGEEGETDDPAIRALRFQMIKNACMVLMCSRGTPMFFAGDEFGNTQFGNNNAYCQDNEISWLDWTMKETNREIFDFFKYMIHLRLKHQILRENTGSVRCGFPPVSLHGTRPWESDYTWETKMIGIMYAGRNKIPGDNTAEQDDIIYLGINTWWHHQEVELPKLPEGSFWIPLADTSRGKDTIISGKEVLDKRIYVMQPRSCVLFTVRRLID